MAISSQDSPMSASGVPLEWTTNDGAVWDVKRWPVRNRTAEWLKNLKNLPDIPIKKDESTKYVEKYMSELDPDAHKDYLILRSKSPIPKRGGSQCHSAYFYRHLFVVKGENDEEGVPCDVDPAVHLRYSRLNNKIVLRGVNSKQVSNFFDTYTAPDQTDSVLPRYSTCASSFEQHMRKNVIGPEGKSDEEICDMVDYCNPLGQEVEDILLHAAEFNVKPAVPANDKKRPAENEASPADQPVRSKPRVAPAKKDAQSVAFLKMVEKLKPEDLDAKTALENIQQMMTLNSSQSWEAQKRIANEKITVIFKYICCCVTDPEKKQNVYKVLTELRDTHIKMKTTMDVLENISALL